MSSQLSEKDIVRVHLIDSSSKFALNIDQDTTISDLRQMVVARTSLKEHTYFSLFEKNDRWERKIDLDEKPLEIKQNWEREKAFKKSGSESIFLFKKEIFLKDDDREMEDLVSKDLIYRQAQHSVITSDYPCSPKDAVRLAALQFQALYGDHNSNHVSRFLLSNIHDFIPKSLLGQKKPQDWESQILLEHEKLIGKTPDAAKTEYLNTVKSWDFYGTTFYPPFKMVGSRAKFIIGIYNEGIRLLKPKVKVVISEHRYYDLISWGSNSTTFFFEFNDEAMTTVKHVFETKQGAIIAANIQNYIEVLITLLKNEDSNEGDVGEEDNESGTTIIQNHPKEKDEPQN